MKTFGQAIPEARKSVGLTEKAVAAPLRRETAAKFFHRF